MNQIWDDKGSIAYYTRIQHVKISFQCRHLVLLLGDLVREGRNFVFRHFFGGVDLRDKGLVLAQYIGANLLEEQFLLRVAHLLLGSLEHDAWEMLTLLDRRRVLRDQFGSQLVSGLGGVEQPHITAMSRGRHYHGGFGSEGLPDLTGFLHHKSRI